MLRVSFGKTPLTPPGGAAGQPMAGYSRPHYAHGVLDDPMARAVLMEDVVMGDIKKKFLIISLDLLKIPMVIAEYIKDKIKEKCNFGLGQGQIIIHAIHTHSAPDLTGEFFWPGGVDKVIKGIMFGANRNDKYIVWMTLRIVKMVNKMLKELRPMKVAWAKQVIDADIMINRRHPIRRSKQTMNVMVFRDLESNELTGILSSYGMHPTTLSAENDKMSADYPGRVCYRIEEKTNNKVFAIYVTKAAGDLNPITTCGTDFETLETDKAARNSVYGQTGTYEHTKKLGYFLGDQALKIANSLGDDHFYDQMQFNSYLKKFWMPFKDYQPFVYDWMNWLQNKFILFVKKWILFPIALTHEEDPNFPGLAIKAFPFSFKKGYNINVYTLIQYSKFTFSKSTDPSQKKDMSILGIPGELFEDIEKNMEGKSPEGAENTFVFQNANDWCAYLFPIKEYITQAGYEPFASTTPVAGHYVEQEMYLLWKEIEEGAQLGFN